MQIQLNTDNHIQGHETLASFVEGEIRAKLDRFRDSVTRVEVHLSDTNATRGGDKDKRCTLEARLAGRQPLTVSHDGSRVGEALHGALDKLLRALNTDLGRLRDTHGRDTIRGETGPAGAETRD